MCLIKDKWPRRYADHISPGYEKAVKGINTIKKIIVFNKNFTRKEDKKDYWQYPWQTWERKTYDCDDMAILHMDILDRNVKTEEMYFIIVGGDYMKEGKRIQGAHAITVAKANIEVGHPAWHEFSNKLIYTHDQEEATEHDFIEWGKRWYPLGIKYFEKRDRTGKVLRRRWKWIGYL